MTSQYEISQEFKEMDYQHSDINRFVNSPVVCLAVLRKPQSFKPLSPLPTGNAVKMSVLSKPRIASASQFSNTP